jgi:hypothetical protein
VERKKSFQQLAFDFFDREKLWAQRYQKTTARYYRRKYFPSPTPTLVISCHNTLQIQEKQKFQRSINQQEARVIRAERGKNSNFY